MVNYLNSGRIYHFARITFARHMQTYLFVGITLMLRDKDHLYNVAVSMESRYAFCNLVSF